eukprot:4717115-Pyramimonas_sp.AAC.1
MSPPAQDSVSWPHRQHHLRPLRRCSHAFPPPRTTLRGPTGSSTCGANGGVRMRLLHTRQRFVAPQGAP